VHIRTSMYKHPTNNTPPTSKQFQHATQHTARSSRLDTYHTTTRHVTPQHVTSQHNTPTHRSARW
jgi:hypothetical protein